MGRDRDLAGSLVQQVRACCQVVQAVLVCTNGWGAYLNSLMRAFREKVKQIAGQRRCALEVWPELCITTVIKRIEKKRVMEVKFFARES